MPNGWLLFSKQKWKHDFATNHYSMSLYSIYINAIWYCHIQWRQRLDIAWNLNIGGIHVLHIIKYPGVRARVMKYNTLSATYDLS